MVHCAVAQDCVLFVVCFSIRVLAHVFCVQTVVIYVCVCVCVCVFYNCFSCVYVLFETKSCLENKNVLIYLHVSI